MGSEIGRTYYRRLFAHDGHSDSRNRSNRIAIMNFFWKIHERRYICSKIIDIHGMLMMNGCSQFVNFIIQISCRYCCVLCNMFGQLYESLSLYFLLKFSWLYRVSLTSLEMWIFQSIFCLKFFTLTRIFIFFSKFFVESRDMIVFCIKYI